MTEEIKQEDNLEPDAAENLMENEAEGANGQPEETSDNEVNPDILINEIGELQAALEEHQNRLLRMQADFDNFRRRNRQEREDLVSFATEGLLTKLLPVLDNFERAIAVEGDNPNMLAGIQMIHRQLVEVLASEGLEMMPTCGCEFDPNLHQAVLMEPSEEVADNHITAELQKGYLVKGKVIRPAMVKVAQN